MVIIAAIVGFIGSIIGALIGGKMSAIASYDATQQAHKNSLKLQQDAKNEAVKNLIQALYDEINTLWERYMWGVGDALEKLKDNEPITWIVPIATQDNYTIYNGNADKIGLIDDHDLRKMIIISYTKARSLIDSYRMNNDHVQKWDYALALLKAGNLQYENEVKERFAIMVNYIEKVKKTHNDIKNDVEKLISLFNKKGFY